MNKLLIYSTITLGLLSAGQSFADNSMEKQMDRIQDHWRMMMNETDEDKRKNMMMDHKMMMDEFEKNSSISNHHMSQGHDTKSKHHMNGMMDNHTDMMNMMDMHRSMMDMMD